MCVPPARLGEDRADAAGTPCAVGARAAGTTPGGDRGKREGRCRPRRHAAPPRRRATMPATMPTTMPAMMLATMLATMFAMMGAMTRIRMAKREGVPGRPSRPGPMQRGRPGGCAPAAPIRRR
jgi:hypothetical protein